MIDAYATHARTIFHMVLLGFSPAGQCLRTAVAGPQPDLRERAKEGDGRLPRSPATAPRVCEATWWREFPVQPHGHPEFMRCD